MDNRTIVRSTWNFEAIEDFRANLRWFLFSAGIRSACEKKTQTSDLKNSDPSNLENSDLGNSDFTNLENSDPAKSGKLTPLKRISKWGNWHKLEGSEFSRFDQIWGV